MDQDDSELQLRLLSCLETILELEGELERLEQGRSLLGEFSQLKSFVEKIDQVRVDEYDVKRIEQATANFLLEIKGILGMPSTDVRHGKPIQ
jgi:ABC-type transporter Mla MlaB component